MGLPTFHLLSFSFSSYFRDLTKSSSQCVCRTAKCGPISFACSSCLRVWLEEAEDEYYELTSFTTFVSCAIARIKILGVVASPSVTNQVQLVISSSDPDLYQSYAVHGRLNAKSYGRTFQVVLAAMARKDEQRRQSFLQRMPKTLHEAPSALYVCSALSSHIL